MALHVERKNARRNRTSKTVGNVRRAVRVLQEIPLVLSAAVVLCFATDFARFEMEFLLCPIFGFSLYMLVRLYAIARRLYVSRWSRLLYIILIFVSATDFLDTIFDFSCRIVEFQQHVFSLFIVGILSSLLTFIYDKFKSTDKNTRSERD